MAPPRTPSATRPGAPPEPACVSVLHAASPGPRDRLTASRARKSPDAGPPSRQRSRGAAAASGPSSFSPAHGWAVCPGARSSHTKGGRLTNLGPNCPLKRAAPRSARGWWALSMSCSGCMLPVPPTHHAAPPSTPSSPGGSQTPRRAPHFPLETAGLLLKRSGIAARSVSFSDMTCPPCVRGGEGSSTPRPAQSTFGAAWPGPPKIRQASHAQGRSWKGPPCAPHAPASFCRQRHRGPEGRPAVPPQSHLVGQQDTGPRCQKGSRWRRVGCPQARLGVHDQTADPSNAATLHASSVRSTATLSPPASSPVKRGPQIPGSHMHRHACLPAFTTCLLFPVPLP